MVNGNGLSTELVEQEHVKPVTLKPTHEYTTKSGVVFQLRPVSPVLVRRIQKDTFGKPQPPVVETIVGPQKRKVKETNPDDPDYKVALAEWNERHEEQTLVYLWSRGVVDDPDPESAARLKVFLPGSSDAEIKYAWLLELLVDDQEIADLAVAIMGQSMPTENGIAAAEATFPGDGEQPAD